ncbi:MAG: hypothetical protein JWO37_4046 [Acidimicrobiales bacterium]|jgi:hypothetical protein|nr:hypothetical protein [Acidimicrobiales bacterium]
MEPGVDVAAWRSFCRRLEAVGEQLLGPAFPQDPADRAEGFAHLAEQVVCWVAWSVSHLDPRSPAFQRQNDLVTKWGGPNADNGYRHARVDPSLRYRITGRMHACEEFILALRGGFMHMPAWGTLHEVTASELGIREGDDFEILLGGPGGIAIPGGACMATVREYYWDWRADEPATFTIECLDGPAETRPRRHADAVAAALEEAIVGVEQSITYWNGYLRDIRRATPDNTFAPTMTLAKGLDAAKYAFCAFDLAPDEALVIDSDFLDARYWSLQLADMTWFESLDLANRIISINHRQARASADGRLQVVVAHDDPGAANWLDTEGRRAGLVTYRWFWSDEEPRPTTSVVKVADVRNGDVDPSARREEVARRRRHVAWRFRT